MVAVWTEEHPYLFNVSDDGKVIVSVMFKTGRVVPVGATQPSGLYTYELMVVVYT